LKLKNQELATSGGVFAHPGFGALFLCFVAVKEAMLD
jgi:hypothetical protein